MNGYDRHNPIIKWYQYDHRKLYKEAESEDVTQQDTADGIPEDTQPDPGPTGDPAMDDEVARIMAQFADAKQNSVDDVFAMMAEKEQADEATLSAADPAMDDEVARIMAQFADAKQNSVDDVFAKMAAEVNGPEADMSAGEDQEELLASLLKPKQNAVDDLVAKAREGN